MRERCAIKRVDSTVALSWSVEFPIIVLVRGSEFGCIVAANWVGARARTTIGTEKKAASFINN
jgi:hypothetical protein